MQETEDTRVRFLGQKDPLEKEMAISSSILAWKISWTEEPGGPQSIGITKSQTQLSASFSSLSPSAFFTAALKIKR